MVKAKKLTGDLLSNYMSCVDFQKDAESPFQFVKSSESEYFFVKSSNSEFYEDDFEQRLQIFFYDTLFQKKNIPSLGIEMLEYHFRKCEDGKKRKFLELIAKSIKGIPVLKTTLLFDQLSFFNLPDFNTKEQAIFAWVDEKKEALTRKEAKSEERAKALINPKPFYEYFTDEVFYSDERKKLFVGLLKEKFAGRGCKKIAFMIKALETQKQPAIINFEHQKYLWASIKTEFGNKETEAGFNKAMKFDIEKRQYKTEFQVIQRKIFDLIDQVKKN